MSVLWPSTIALDTAYIWKHSIFEWPLGQSSSSSTPAKYFHNFTALVPGLNMFSHAKERDPRRETVSKFSIFFELLSSGLFLFLHRERERRSSVAVIEKLLGAKRKHSQKVNSFSTFVCVCVFVVPTTYLLHTYYPADDVDPVWKRHLFLIKFVLEGAKNSLKTIFEILSLSRFWTSMCGYMSRETIRDVSMEFELMPQKNCFIWKVCTVIDST